MKILILNAGSSTQKAALFDITSGASIADVPKPLWEANIEWANDKGGGSLTVRTPARPEPVTETLTDGVGRRQAVAHVLGRLWSGASAVLTAPTDISAIGHRIVHGGREYQETTRVTADVKAVIARLAPLAPEHNPAGLEGIEAAEQLFGAELPQFAAFDTAFHSTLPDAAALYPGPYDWWEQDIRRFGFHGISHRYCAERAAHLLGRELTDLRLITCHLGNGCSLAAIRDGKSVDTTMGFTPLDGLMMGSRSGSVDPGLLLYLIREKGMTADRLSDVLNRESGLKGVSGVSGDMREIIAAIEAGNDRARLAFDVFLHRLRWHIGAMLPSLDRLDALIFAGGIGEHSAIVRAAACENLGLLGIRIDATKNDAQTSDDRDISAIGTGVRIFVVVTQEDTAIARDCAVLMKQERTV